MLNWGIRKVFFLGAGFSKAINCNYPLLSELSEKVKYDITKETQSINVSM